MQHWMKRSAVRTRCLRLGFITRFWHDHACAESPCAALYGDGLGHDYGRALPQRCPSVQLPRHFTVHQIRVAYPAKLFFRLWTVFFSLHCQIFFFSKRRFQLFTFSAYQKYLILPRTFVKRVCSKSANITRCNWTGDCSECKSLESQKNNSVRL